MPSSPPSDLGLAAKSIAYHPTEAELRSYADAMPQARQTEYGNVNVQTKVVSRSKGSTYVVTDRPTSTATRPSTGRKGPGWPPSRTSTSAARTWWWWTASSATPAPTAPRPG